MHVRVRLFGHPDLIIVVESKLTKIDQFRKIIKAKFDVEPKLQQLFYGGKLLENGYTFHDYNIKLNDVIQLIVRAQQVEETPKEEEEEGNEENKQEPSSKVIEKNIVYEDGKSDWFEVGDLVDVKDKKHGAWFEATVIRIVKDPNCLQPDKVKVNSDKESTENIKKTHSQNNSMPKKNIIDFFSNQSESENIDQVSNSSLEDGLLYKVKFGAVFSEESDEEVAYHKLKEIRPRAKKELDIEKIQVGQKVMVNYNEANVQEKGYWYDFKICNIKKLRSNNELIGTIYLGPEAIPQNDTKLTIHDKLFAVEELVPLDKQSDDDKKNMKSPVEKRSAPLHCLTCRDNDEMPCKDCGCSSCSGKEAEDEIIMCDECNSGYHMYCLSPPLTKLPKGDWYCSLCKIDTNSVVAPGGAKQAKKANTSKSKRDWGRGMACVGKTKTCAMPANHFGPIPGIEVGMCWRFRIQLSETGVHRPPVSGIHGRDVEGAYSIVLSGGYEDDVDHGVEFTYTGSGGRDLSGNKRTAEQSCNQTLTRENKALARNCAVKQVSENGGDAGDNWREGKPVRVVRSYKMLKHFPKYAPKEGIRYDGIYKVVKYYPEKGKSGFIVWKYLLRRDDQSPAPWVSGAKQYPIIYPDGYLEAEAEKKALKEKSSKNNKATKKRAVKNSDSFVDDKENNSLSPPQKKRKTRSTADKSPEAVVGKRGRASKNVIESDSDNASVSDSPKTPTIPSIFKTAKSPKNETDKTKQLEDLLTKDELAAIQEDTLNKKLWTECFETSVGKVKKDYLDQVTSLFLCIICQDVVSTPVTTKCLHNFCSGCIKLAFKSTGIKSCPCCRRDLSNDELEPNEKLKLALRALMPGYDAGKK